MRLCVLGDLLLDVIVRLNEPLARSLGGRLVHVRDGHLEEDRDVAPHRRATDWAAPAAGRAPEPRATTPGGAPA